MRATTWLTLAATGMVWLAATGDAGAQSLGVFEVPALAGDGSRSFLGVRGEHGHTTATLHLLLDGDIGTFMCEQVFN